MEAQRIVQELEANTDTEMMPVDSTTSRFPGAEEDTDGRKKKKIVPTDVRAWVLDETMGNPTRVDVDTLQHQYQNSNLPEGVNGHYNSLGNLGSPRMSRIYTERPDMMDFMFLTPMDQFFVTTDRFPFYNTKSPYFNLAYNFCGSRDTGYDHVKTVFTTNIGKRINFGGKFDYMYGQGYYGNQSTSFINGSAWGSYIGERYDVHFYYQHNFMKMAENGGIVRETFITNPELENTNYGSKDFPTNLRSTWNRQEHDVFFLNHHYNLGFYKDDPADTTGTKHIFVPVTRFFHTFKLGKLMRNYRSYLTANDYYENEYYRADTTNDRTNNFYVRNVVGVSLAEGFNKWAAFGINLFAGHEFRDYTMIDSAFTELSPRAVFMTTKHKKNDFFVGGQIIRTQGKSLHFDVNARFVFAGERIGDLDVNGSIDYNFMFWKDTATVKVNAFIKNLTPSYYVRHFHSRYAWWDFDAKKEWKTRIEGIVSSRKTGTTIIAGLENIKNYTYFQNVGSVTPGLRANVEKHSVIPVQESSMIQVISLTLRQNFKFGIFHLDNDFTYQICTNKTALPLPAITTYHNLYLFFRIAKVLKTELGADLRYFTEYNAPTYSPIIGMFSNQNPDNIVKIGNYPIVSAYVNFDLKKVRFYVQYYHVNKSHGRYFWAPGYPISPGGLHMGLSWNFYD